MNSAADSHARSRRAVELAWRVGAPLAALWLAVWLFVSWPAVQDDAFIHLRFAENLLRFHKVTYNGAATEFGASSLLYIGLLAALRSVTGSPLLPRAVSTAGHIALFCGLLATGLRRTRWSATASLAGLVLLGTMAGPSSVRWLDDGMESSLVLCCVTGVAWLAVRLSRVERVPPHYGLGLGLLGVLTVLLRVELLLFLVAVALMLASERWRLIPLWRGDGGRGGGRTAALMPSIALLGGGLLAAVSIRIAMGSLLPDTALAKSGGLSYGFRVLAVTRIAITGSMSLGVLSLLLWLLTAALLLRQRGLGAAWLLANSLFPVVLMLAMLRGQAVQGIRHIEWTLLFPVVWNLLELAEDEPAAALLRFDSDPGYSFRESVPRRSAAYRVLRGATVLLAVGLLAAQPIEALLLRPVFLRREHSLAQFRSQHLERLHTIPVVAFDVGYIGYFTGAPLCDMAGLVNGRQAALTDYDQRMRHCRTMQPGVAFGNLNQLDDLNFRLSLVRWQICAEYDLANLRSLDTHYLVASPEAAPAVCAAAGGTPQPLLPLLPPGSR